MRLLKLSGCLLMALILSSLCMNCGKTDTVADQKEKKNKVVLSRAALGYMLGSYPSEKPNKAYDGFAGMKEFNFGGFAGREGFEGQIYSLSTALIFKNESDFGVFKRKLDKDFQANFTNTTNPAAGIWVIEDDNTIMRFNAYLSADGVPKTLPLQEQLLFQTQPAGTYCFVRATLVDKKLETLALDEKSKTANSEKTSSAETDAEKMAVDKKMDAAKSTEGPDSKPAIRKRPAPVRVTLTGGIEPPRSRCSGPLPYPEKAKEKRVSGLVMIEVTVLQDGTLQGIKILRENPADAGFGDAAKKYYSQCEWSPGKRNGQALDTVHSFAVQFRLKQ